jgi:hypothetical protein
MVKVIFTVVWRDCEGRKGDRILQHERLTGRNGPENGLFSKCRDSDDTVQTSLDRLRV